MFHSVATGVPRLAGRDLEIHLHDVQTLNELALTGRYDVTKVSFYTYLLARREYELLNVGAALGFGCGPLVVATRPLSPAEIAEGPVAIPGELTTAHMLFRLWSPQAKNKVFVRYDQVMDCVASGEAACGVIIHEGRFVYLQRSLCCLADLGQWWLGQTQLPIPLGGILIRKSLPRPVILEFEQALRQSIRHSMADPGSTTDYVRRHAQEMDGEVLTQHVKMFVNEFSLDLGDRGRLAVAKLEELARQAGALA